MNKKVNILSCLAFLICSISVYGQLVTTTSELNTAISNATPGTTITLANQTWTDVNISINKTGTFANPITIKAQTQGSVFFEGNCSVQIGGDYIIFEGVIFQNPSNLDTSSPLIDFRASGNDCNNCTVTNIKIDAFNGTSAQETDVYKWIYLRGQYNEISYSSFVGKNGVGSIINDNRSSGIANYNRIHHNYFADRTPVGAINDLNDQDAIRIGSSSTSLSDSFTEIYSNYFYNFSGEVEVISNKSGKNKYYNNTFDDYQGTLTLRHGNGCEVFNNFFFANDNAFTGGIRVIGEDHKIYNNYIEGVNSRKPDNSLSGATGGINVSNGKPNSALNEYYQVKNTTIVNNTLVNCDYGIRVGTEINSSLTLEPENLIIANNVIYENSDNALQVINTPSGALSKFEGNIKQNGSWDITTGTNGNISVTSGLLMPASDFYRISSGSAAIDSGIGSYSFLTDDITDGPRPSSYDAGAEEFGSGGTSGPYSQTDVGVNVGYGATSDNITVGSLPTFIASPSSNDVNVSANVSWTATPNDSWISVNPTSGSGNATVSVSVLQNPDITSRTGTVTFSQNPGGDDIVRTLTVTQDGAELTDLYNLINDVAGGGPVSVHSFSKEQVDLAASPPKTNYATNTLDKDFETHWTADDGDILPGDYKGDGEYVIFDLGDQYSLDLIQIATDDKPDPYGLQVWVSTTGTQDVDFSMLLPTSGDLLITTTTGVDDAYDQYLVTANARYVKLIGFGRFTNSGTTRASMWNNITEIEFFGDLVLSIGDLDSQEIEFYPNPVRENLTIKTSNNSTLSSYELYSIEGRLIANDKIEFVNSSASINMSEFANGIYILNVSDSVGNRVSKKIIIAK